MLVCAWDVFNNVSNPVGLGLVQVLNESGDLDEGPTAGVLGPLVFARIRVRLARGSSYDDVYAVGEGLETGWADAVGVEGESAVPADEG